MFAHQWMTRWFRVLLLSTVLTMTFSTVVVPRAHAFSYLEFSVILSAIKNSLEAACASETPDAPVVAGLQSYLAANAPAVTLVTGTAGPDSLTGTAGPDIILGFGGNDVLSGLDGIDILCGGPGDDILIGGPDDDLLIGAPGTDQLFPDDRPLPQMAADCKDDGWQQYGLFKNQGDCVSFVATDGRNAGAGP